MAAAAPAYSMQDLMNMFNALPDDASKYAFGNAIMNGPNGSGFDSALRQQWGSDYAKAWITKADNSGVKGDFDPATGAISYHDIGNPNEAKTGEWQYKTVPVNGWDPTRYNNTISSDYYHNFMENGKSGITQIGPGASVPGPRSTSTSTDPGGGPVVTPPPNPSTGRTLNPGSTTPYQSPNAPTNPRVPITSGPPPFQAGGPPTPGGRTPGTNPWGSAPEPPDFGAILAKILGKTPPPSIHGGPPGTTNGPPGTNNGPPPPNHGTSPYPNINAMAGGDNPTYTGLPLRSFDPSYLIQSMRQHFGGKSGAGQTYQIPPQQQQGLQNNLQAWDSIFAKG